MKKKINKKTLELCRLFAKVGENNQVEFYIDNPVTVEKEDIKEPQSQEAIDNRQILLLLITSLNLTLDQVNISALAKLASRITGRSEESLRQKAIELRDKGSDTKVGTENITIIADLLQDLGRNDLAKKMQNEIKEN